MTGDPPPAAGDAGGVLQEQMKYYRARAAEYDEVYGIGRLWLHSVARS